MGTLNGYMTNSRTTSNTLMEHSFANLQGGDIFFEESDAF